MLDGIKILNGARVDFSSLHCSPQMISEASRGIADSW